MISSSLKRYGPLFSLLIVMLLMAVISFSVSAVEPGEISGLIIETQNLMDRLAQDAAADPNTPAEDLKFLKEQEGQLSPDVTGQVDSALWEKDMDPDTIHDDDANAEASSTNWGMLAIVLVVVLVGVGGFFGGKKAVKGIKDRKKAGRSLEKGDFEKLELGKHNLALSDHLISSSDASGDKARIAQYAKEYVNNIEVLKKHFPADLFAFKDADGKHELFKQHFDVKATEIKADYKGDLKILLHFVLSFRDGVLKKTGDLTEFNLQTYDFTHACYRFAEQFVKAGYHSKFDEAGKTLSAIHAIIVTQGTILEERKKKYEDEKIRLKMTDLEVLFNSQMRMLHKLHDLLESIREAALPEARQSATQYYKDDSKALLKLVEEELKLEKGLKSMQVAIDKQVKKDTGKSAHSKDDGPEAEPETQDKLKRWLEFTNHLSPFGQLMALVSEPEYRKHCIKQSPKVAVILFTAYKTKGMSIVKDPSQLRLLVNYVTEDPSCPPEIKRIIKTFLNSGVGKKAMELVAKEAGNQIAEQSKAAETPPKKARATPPPLPPDA
ncbi:MAG: hypothetical protein V1729_05280 [Candidatus Woesearchaeota archaeon]